MFLNNNSPRIILLQKEQFNHNITSTLKVILILILIFINSHFNLKSLMIWMVY
jgi:hypothetical protein